MGCRVKIPEYCMYMIEIQEDILNGNIRSNIRSTIRDNPNYVLNRFHFLFEVARKLTISIVGLHQLD